MRLLNANELYKYACLVKRPKYVDTIVYVASTNKMLGWLSINRFYLRLIIMVPAFL